MGGHNLKGGGAFEGVKQRSEENIEKQSRGGREEASSPKPPPQQCSWGPSVPGKRGGGAPAEAGNEEEPVM